MHARGRLDVHADVTDCGETDDRRVLATRDVERHIGGDGEARLTVGPCRQRHLGRLEPERLAEQYPQRRASCDVATCETLGVKLIRTEHLLWAKQGAGPVLMPAIVKRDHPDAGAGSESA